MREFLKKLMSSFIKPKIIVDADDITEIDITENNQLNDDKIYIGLLIRSKLRRLLNEGDISSNIHNKFIQGVKAIYVTAVTYALNNFPLEDELLKHAQFVDLKRRLDSSLVEVTYFVERFAELLPHCNVKDQELLFEQFIAFQTMQDTFIPTHVWNSAKVYEK